MQNRYALEYSVQQKAWHIDKLDAVLSKNLNMIKGEISNDYKIIFIGDYETCCVLADKFFDSYEKFESDF